MDTTTYSFFEAFSNDSYCLLYDGNIVDEVTDKIIDLSEYNYEHEEDYAQSRKKVSFLLAECFQNIIRHGGSAVKKHVDAKDPGFFLTRNHNGTYFIISGNLIKNKNVAGFKAQLNKINQLDKDELKVLYRNVLTNHGFTQRGGAGLGLIEIARKSGQKIEYLFYDFDDEHSMFYSQVMIKQKKQYQQHTGYHLLEAIEFHQKMIAENIFIIQKGDFSKGSLAPVIEIMQNNLNEMSVQQNPRKDAYHVLVELLQNISRYALEQNHKKEGLFFIKRKGDNLVISAGNLVTEAQIVNLRKQFDLLNGLSKAELKKKYLESLKEEKDAQIELIDIARRAKAEIDYNFKKVITGQYFFSIMVTV